MELSRFAPPAARAQVRLGHGAGARSERPCGRERRATNAPAARRAAPPSRMFPRWLSSFAQVGQARLGWVGFWARIRGVERLERAGISDVSEMRERSPSRLPDLGWHALRPSPAG